MPIFPGPEELYPDWRDWAKALGRYLVDEEMERRREVSQRLGRFFINYQAKVTNTLVGSVIYTARLPYRIIGMTNAWNGLAATSAVVIAKITPPTTAVNLEWTHGSPVFVSSPETSAPSAIFAATGGLCTAHAEVEAGEILRLIEFHTLIAGNFSLTIEAEDLSWNR